MAIVLKNLCQGCGACIRICTKGAIRAVATSVEIEGELCDDCEECVFACPNGAITV